MDMTTIKKLPTAEEIIQEIPLSDAGHEQVVRDRQEVKNILSGKDDRLLLIVGPCSAWPYDPVVEYGKRLKELSDKVKDKLKLVIRVYIQKPRTAKGWTGPVNQPDVFAAPDIEAGAKYARKLMVELIEMGLPIADEALFTHNAKGFIELLSWVAIGARSVEDQEHRIFASAVGCAVGMKNATSGSIEIGTNGIVAAQYPHTAVFNGYQVRTAGNPFAHLILRGGAKGPNYHLENMYEAKELFDKHGIINPAIIVDASHDNCKVDGKKDEGRMVEIVEEVMKNIEDHPELKNLMKGFMIESFLKTGNQKVDTASDPDKVDMDGLSITDPCLGWDETEKLILRLAQIII